MCRVARNGCQKAARQGFAVATARFDFDEAEIPGGGGGRLANSKEWQMKITRPVVLGQPGQRSDGLGACHGQGGCLR